MKQQRKRIYTFMQEIMQEVMQNLKSAGRVNNIVNIDNYRFLLI